jgi:hypothetical protein
MKVHNMSKAAQSTKLVKCKECKNDIEVQKWASNSQTCPKCLEKPKKKLELVPNSSAMDVLKFTQQIMSELDFTITASGYFKRYSDGDGIIKVEPYWDKGISSDITHALVALTVTRQEYINVLDPHLFDKIPKVAHGDVNALLSALKINTKAGNIAQTHVDTVRCSKCNDETADWMQFEHQILCLSKCAPVRRPYRAGH